MIQANESGKPAAGCSLRSERAQFVRGQVSHSIAQVK
jgi:hypothetical protein